MANLHNFATQTGIVLGNIGQKVKNVAEIAGAAKTIWQIGSFFKNAILPVAEVAAIAL